MTLNGRLILHYVCRAAYRMSGRHRDIDADKQDDAGFRRPLTLTHSTPRVMTAETRESIVSTACK